MTSFGYDPRIEIIFDLIAQIASGNKVKPKKEVEAEDEFNAIILGLKMMAEELEHQKKIQSESEKLYKNLYEMAPVIYIVLDQDGIITDCSREFPATLGYIKEDIIQKPLTDFYTESSAKHFIAEGWPTTLRGERVDKQERQLVKKDGEIVDVLLNANPIFDDKKNVIGCRTIFVNITDRKKLITDLKDSEEKFHTVFQHSNDMIILHRPKGEIIEANHKAMSFFGYSQDEFLLKKVGNLHPEKAKKTALKRSAQILKTGRVEMEIDFQKKDGKIFPAELSANVIELKGEKVIQGVIRDLTYRKELERELLRTEKLASVGHLAAGVAHRLRNPLAVILSATKMLHRFENQKDDFQKTIAAIERNGNRAVEVVQDLLHFTKQKDLFFQQLKVDSSVRKAVKLVEADLARRRIKIKTKFGGTKVKAYYDQDAMLEVFTNLFRNSIDACITGGIIAVEVGNSGQNVSVEINDNGCGIEAEDLGQIYDPFFTTKPQGSGIGLAECHRIMVAHWGSINVESEKGIGTTVTLKLPVKKMQGGGESSYLTD